VVECGVLEGCDEATVIPVFFGIDRAYGFSGKYRHCCLLDALGITDNVRNEVLRWDVKITETALIVTIPVTVEGSRYGCHSYGGPNIVEDFGVHGSEGVPLTLDHLA
jgi:hypothetical protein